jgi:hypothetical protein
MLKVMRAFNYSLSSLMTAIVLSRTIVAVLSFGSLTAVCQETPLISGGVGFLSNTNGGNTSYSPIIEPLIMLPIGPRFQLESRAAIVESFSPVPGNGYDTSHFAAFTYLQGDYFVTPHLTLIAGDFLIPFGTYNERLSPLWIGNFQSGPLIASIGAQGTGSGLGGQVRGSAISRHSYSVDYAAYFSARTGNEQFAAQRSFGGRSSLYLPQQRLEVGLSYNRQLQGTHENFYGGHLWWEPADTNFRLRSEFARGHHAQGYWVEFDYRGEKWASVKPWLGGFEPLFRMQQTWRRDTVVSDGVPLANTVRADFGLDYNLPHNTRILTSYSRQFASTGNVNIWQTGIVYRFLFPAWKGRK